MNSPLFSDIESFTVKIRFLYFGWQHQEQGRVLNKTSTALMILLLLCFAHGKSHSSESHHSDTNLSNLEALRSTSCSLIRNKRSEVLSCHGHWVQNSPICVVLQRQVIALVGLLPSCEATIATSEAPWSGKMTCSWEVDIGPISRLKTAFESACIAKTWKTHANSIKAK